MKKIIGYLLTTLGLFIFQLVYHHFGHGVISQTLRYVWLLPLAGLLIWLVLQGFFKQRVGEMTFKFLNAAVASLIFWASVNGILEIAGSDSPYLFVYWIVAAIMGLATLISLLFPNKTNTK